MDLLWGGSDVPVDRYGQPLCSGQSFGAGGITVDLPVPPFKSPDSWFSPVYIGTSRMRLKDRVKLEKGKKQNPRFRIGLFGVFLAWEEMRHTKVEEARSEAMQRNWKGKQFSPGAHTPRGGGQQLKFWDVRTNTDSCLHTQASSAGHCYGPSWAGGKMSSKRNCQTHGLLSIKAEIPAAAQVVCKP